jgi:hypothetical protein
MRLGELDVFLNQKGLQDFFNGLLGVVTDCISWGRFK